MRELDAVIGKRIRELLKDKDWSPWTLCQQTGIASGYMTELLNLHPKRRWNTDQLGKVARALGVPAWQLFADPRDLIPAHICDLAAKYEKLEGDDKRIVDAMLATAGRADDTKTPRRRVKKSRAT